MKRMIPNLNSVFCFKTLLIAVFAFALTCNVFSQTGSSCANAHDISSLPFSATGLSTTTNNITSANVCGDSKYGGVDYVFKYTAPSNLSVDIKVTNSPTGTALYVTKACPAGGSTCLAKKETITGFPEIANLEMEQGIDYYIIFSYNQYFPATPFDIQITSTAIIENDAGISTIISPVSNCDLASQAVSVQVRNFGKNTIAAIDLSYQIDNLPVVKETPTLNLASNASIVYTFNTLPNLSVKSKTYSIKVFTTYSGDTNYDNDKVETSITYLSEINTFPYLENFESGAGGWVAEWDSAAFPFNSWALGKPAKTSINTAASGVNAWITGITSNTNTNEASYVLSPCFDFSNLSDPYIYMKIAYNTGETVSGMNLQVSVDNGFTWFIVGKSGDPYWYNSPVMAEFPGGWLGESKAWLITYHSLNSGGLNLAGLPSVMFRVFFLGSGSNEGVAFDDFQIVDGFIPVNNKAVVKANKPISVYPNPASDNLEVICPDCKDVKIIDIIGKQRLFVNGEKARNIDISFLENGIYFVIMNTTAGVKQQKIVVKK